MTSMKKKRNQITSSIVAEASDSITELQNRDLVQTSKALKNEKILGLIFQHFDLQPGSRTVAQNRKDLFSVAKTCKAFVELALDLLWRVLPSLLPLLMLLPSAEVNNGHYFVDELPLDDDANEPSGWRRFDLHARRVRTLYMEPLHIVISPDIYLRIHAMRASPLLPGLRKICIPYTSGKGYLDLSSALFLAMGSTLDMIELDGDAASDRQFFVPFLSSLHIKSPGLTHLSLSGTVPSASVEPIYRFKELQSLKIRLCDPKFPPQLLHKLGQLPHLLDLIIDTGDVATSILPLSNPISISNSKFRQLRHLEILGTTTSISCILNELKGLTNLNALKIDEVWDGWAGISANSYWRSFIEVISTFPAVENIQISNRSRAQLKVLASSLEPLFRLKNLKSLIIDLHILLSDDDFRELAGGFPKLEKFVVPGPPFRERTLACLYHLSREGLALREIEIALSSDISDNLDAIKKLPHPIDRNHQHPLEKLYIDSNFGQLQPIQFVQVARFLDRIFPNLSTLEAADDSKMTETANWAGIHELLLALQDARTNLNPVSDSESRADSDI